MVDGVEVVARFQLGGDQDIGRRSGETSGVAVPQARVGAPCERLGGPIDDADLEVHDHDRRTVPWDGKT